MTFLTYSKNMKEEVENLLKSNLDNHCIEKHNLFYVKQFNEISIYKNEFIDKSIFENTNLKVELAKKNLNRKVKKNNGQSKVLRRYLTDQKVNMYYRYNILVGIDNQGNIVEIPFLKYKYKE